MQTTYRVADPIGNLKLQVILRKRATVPDRWRSSQSSAAPATTVDKSLRGKDRERQRGRELEADRVGSSGEYPSAAADGPDDEEGRRGRRPRGRTGKQRTDGEDEEDRDPTARDDETRPLRDEDVEDAQLEEEVARATLQWQQKIFGRSEVLRMRRLEQERAASSGGGGVLRRLLGRGRTEHVNAHIQEMLAQREREAEEEQRAPYRGETLYTRVHSEGFVDASEWHGKQTTSADEQLTPLARSVLSSASVKEHRDLLGEAASVCMWILADLPDADLPSGSPPPRSLSSRMSRASLADVDEDPTRTVVLCALKAPRPKPPRRVDPCAARLRNSLPRHAQTGIFKNGF